MNRPFPTVLAALFLFAGAAVPILAANEDLQADLLSREKALWTAWGKKDGNPTRKDAVESYVQVVAGVGMVQGREAVAAEIEKHDCVLKSFDFKDAKLRRPAPDVAILSYVATQDTTCGGQRLPKKLFVTSVWQRYDGEWKAYSYQETPID
jgi:hypothetical protein